MTGFRQMYMAYHLKLAQEEGRITSNEAMRLAGHLMLVAVGVENERTTAWRHRKLAERAGLASTLDECEAEGHRRSKRQRGESN